MVCNLFTPNFLHGIRPNDTTWSPHTFFSIAFPRSSYARSSTPFKGLPDLAHAGSSRTFKSRKQASSDSVHKSFIGSVYGFFRIVTRLPASSLVSPHPFLRQSGFVRVRRAEFDWGLLCAELWKRA